MTWFLYGTVSSGALASALGVVGPLVWDVSETYTHAVLGTRPGHQSASQTFTHVLMGARPGHQSASQTFTHVLMGARPGHISVAQTHTHIITEV